MLEQYRKTFRGMQIMIAVITGLVLIWTRRWNIATGFFVVMQLGAIFGAAWGSNLKYRILRRRSELLR